MHVEEKNMRFRTIYKTNPSDPHRRQNKPMWFIIGNRLDSRVAPTLHVGVPQGQEVLPDSKQPLVASPPGRLGVRDTHSEASRNISACLNAHPPYPSFNKGGIFEALLAASLVASLNVLCCEGAQ